MLKLLVSLKIIGKNFKANCHIIHISCIMFNSDCEPNKTPFSCKYLPLFNIKDLDIHVS